MSPTCPVDGINTFRILDTLNKILQFRGSVAREPREGRLFPQRGQDIGFARGIVLRARGRAACVSSHDIRDLWEVWVRLPRSREEVGGFGEDC